LITGSLEVETEERKVSLAWVWSSERVGISITFGWCRMAVVVPACGYPKPCLDHPCAEGLNLSDTGFWNSIHSKGKMKRGNKESTEA